MRRTLLSTFLLASLASTAPAQIELGGRNLFSFDGEAFLGRFGWSVAAGDVNGDGYTDLIAGAPSELIPAVSGGLVRVFSGRDGTLLHEIPAEPGGGELGEAVAALGDLNGDGAEEFAAGDPEGQVGNEFPGYVRVYDGATGAKITTLKGDVFFDAFGQAVAGVGDVDLDGVPDIAVGAPRPQTLAPFQPGAGFVRVFSGVDGQPLATLNGANLYDRYGDAVAGAGDVNLDGHADVLVGVPGFDSNGLTNNGRAEVISGEWIASTALGLTPTTPKLLGASDGDFEIGSLGFAVAGVGDTNGDGYPEVLAGAPNSDLNGFYRGVADLISGEWIASTSIGATPLTPRVLDRFAGEGERDLFGRSVSAMGDVDADGTPDFVIGASEAFSPGPGPGYATIYSGATGDDIYTYRGAAGGDRVGWAIAGGNADFNADGVPDLAMGADLESGDINGFGTAHMLSGRALTLSADEHLVSVADGGTQTFFLNAGPTNAGLTYLLLGSASGTSPGTPLLDSGLTLPLNLDAYLLSTLNLGNPLLVAPIGSLDQGGEAFASLVAPPATIPVGLVGLTVHHAFVAIQVAPTIAFTLLSDPVPTTLS